MKKEHLIHFCFLLTLSLTVLNLIVIINLSTNFPVFISRGLAYLPLILPLVGFGLISSLPNKVPKHIWLFIAFVFSYYLIGISSNLIGFKLEELKRILGIHSRSLLEAFFYFSYMYYVFKKGKLDMVMKFVTVVFFLASISIPVFYFLEFEVLNLIRGYTKPVDFAEVIRPSGVNGNANDAAFSVNMTVLFLLYHLFKVKKFVYRIGLFCLLFIAIACLIFTFSNTNMFIAITLILAAMYKSRFYSGNSLKSILIFAVLGIAVSLFIYQNPIKLHKLQISKIENLWNVLTFQRTKIDYTGRDELAELALKLVKEKPLTGHGLGVFSILKGHGAHNTYILIIGNAGIVPLVFFLAFVILFLINGIRHHGIRRPVGFLSLGFFLAYSISSVASHNMIGRSEYYFVMFLIIYTSTNYLKRANHQII